MARYAIVRDGTGYVENVSTWDGTTPWTPPTGTTAVQIGANETCVTGEGIGPGCTRNGNGTYTFGVPPVDPLMANKQTLLSQLPGALDACDDIVSRGNLLLQKAAYGTANLANLNDLLDIVKQIVGGPNKDGNGGLMAVAKFEKQLMRLAGGLLDETN